MTSPSQISYGKSYAVGAAGVALLVFIASLLFAPFYFSGDQQFYRLTYENMSGLNLMEAYSLYPLFMSSKELGHFITIWMTSGFGIEKNLVMAVVNSLLAFFVMKLFEKWSVSLFVASTICITNYYMLVLYFSAERLKFAVLFFIMSVYYLQNTKKSFALSFLAIVSHVQMLIMYAALLSPKFFLNDFFRTGSIFKPKDTSALVSILIFITGAVLVWMLMGYQITSKIDYYLVAKNGARTPLDLLKAASIFCLTLLYTKRRAEVALAFIPIFILIFLIGNENVNMFAFAIFICYVSRYRRGLNFGILITSIYFCFKSVNFIQRTIATGQGF